MFHEEKFKTAATIVRQNSFYDDFAIFYATEFFNWMTDYISHLHAISSVIWYLMIFFEIDKTLSNSNKENDSLMTTDKIKLYMDNDKFH